MLGEGDRDGWPLAVVPNGREGVFYQCISARLYVESKLTCTATLCVQIPLFCELVDLLDEGTPVVPPEDLVFSTQPRKATGRDGCSYFVKGPDLNIVVAEAVAHQLARHLGLEVPDFGLVLPIDGRGPLFASKEVARCYRQVELWIRQGKTSNGDMLASMSAFDVWVMNKDRNINNLVGEAHVRPANELIKLVAIDFEKSMALRGPYPLTTTPEMRPRSLRPSGTLENLLRGQACPDSFLRKIEGMTEDHVRDAFGRVEARLGEQIGWRDSSTKLLGGRATKIREHVAEVWR